MKFEYKMTDWHDPAVRKERAKQMQGFQTSVQDDDYYQEKAKKREALLKGKQEVKRGPGLGRVPPGEAAEQSENNFLARNRQVSKGSQSFHQARPADDSKLGKYAHASRGSGGPSSMLRGNSEGPADRSFSSSVDRTREERAKSDEYRGADSSGGGGKQRHVSSPRNPSSCS